MTIALGVDSLCWHLRIERGAVSVEQVLEQAAGLELRFVQLNLHHVRERPLEALHELSERGRALGVTLRASGDFVGSATRGDAVEHGVTRVSTWLERASALSSPQLRIASGFYRAELAGRPDLIDAERRHVTDVVRACLPAAEQRGIALALENHSDFAADEFVRIVEDVGSEHMGVFLDLINPVAALEQPVGVVERLAPFALAGHIKDYVIESIQTDDGYHRRGFSVLYRYPGEGAAPIAELLATLRDGIDGREFVLSIEGLDNRADVDDQHLRLQRSLRHLGELLG